MYELCPHTQNFTWEHAFFRLGLMMPPDKMHQTDAGTTKHLIQRCILLIEYYYQGMARSKKTEEFDRCIVCRHMFTMCRTYSNIQARRCAPALHSATSLPEGRLTS
jgi:hypothetical protein